MVECKDCRHFHVRPGDTVWKRKTGCYHPELMEQSQSDGFLKEQEIPGDAAKINADRKCPKFEVKPARESWVARVTRAIRA
jgi:hypothetical protein